MKNFYITLWVINFFIGTGFLSNELQEDESYFSSANQHEYFSSFYSGEKLQHHSQAFYDFEFDYLLLINEKPVQSPFSGNVIKVYNFFFIPQTSISPLLYDLPPPDSMV